MTPERYVQCLILATTTMFASLASAQIPASATLVDCETLEAIDGDSVRCNGENLRIMGSGAPHISGVDAPEIHGGYAGFKCMAEKMLGDLAKARMASLLDSAEVRIWDSGERDATQSTRRLVWVELQGGTTAGQTLIDEGYAVEWLPDAPTEWCGSQ